MTLSAALSTALSGITMNARLSDVTASNVSNALTEGYARRELLLSAKTFGGVAITGVQRNINQALLNDLRLAAANTGARDPAAGFLSRLENLIGAADNSASLSGRIASLGQTLLEAAARPDAEARLSAVVDAAKSLASGLNSLSDHVQTERENADRTIAAEVDALNANLQRVADLNLQIRAFRANGRDISGLLDQRQQMVDKISSLVPLREIPRENDQIALYTSGGTLLLDGRPAEFGFTAARAITPDMTIQSGALSGLTLNGKPISVEPAGGRLGEGRLTALFALRDDEIPRAQAQLDGLARDLIARFADPALDPSLAPGVPGLFTDASGAFVPGDEPGLASRIAVNTALSPEDGGAVFRLRDGIGAALPGLAGDSRLLAALANALSVSRLPVSPAFPDRAGSTAELAAGLTSAVSYRRLAAEQEQSFAAAQSDGLKSAMLKDGVDTDQEMQVLLILEKAYAANAKVIQTVDDMLATILGI